MDNKHDWLSVTVHSFKPSGKWYEEEIINIPNTLSMYERRKYLDSVLEKGFFSYVCLDSGILGFPYLLHTNNLRGEQPTRIMYEEFKGDE